MSSHSSPQLNHSICHLPVTLDLPCLPHTPQQTPAHSFISPFDYPQVPYLDYNFESAQSPYTISQFIADSNSLIFPSTDTHILPLVDYTSSPTPSNKEKRKWHCTYDGCDKVYTRNYSLKMHVIAAHEQRRAHECGVEGCDKKFARKHDLIRHQVTHKSGDRKFICSICTKRFNRKEHLKVHLGSKNCVPIC
ncbi:hypothetical protein BC833DRAFT_562897 [Globomyces pollinis-pini]|nr:hypothetical protein BC833DRAFT_562897 [Globomyces pollinis-pini]